MLSASKKSHLLINSPWHAIGSCRDGRHDGGILSDDALRAAHLELGPIGHTKSNVVCARQPSVIRWKWYVITDPEDSSKLHEHVVIFSRSPCYPAWLYQHSSLYSRLHGAVYES